ncbi:MAG: 2-oxoglutarate dehydrogenase complex dihydrolipoyllysine-residue succinyltransferase [Phycisphaerales bacterium]|nr:2-oxoglutarate dehydrogenase complex dihydrolipoyllysine-residue succinyltransferase [Phycisphaerales bacterium]
MAVSITVPSPGESITEVTLGSWHHADGDWVEKDDLLVEIESDKATLEVRAPQTGRLSVKAKTGEELKVGSAIGEIDIAAKPPKGAAAPAKAAEREAEATPQPAPEADTDGTAAKTDGPRATSVARKLAADKGVDLARVHGSGPSGRITKEDVMAASTSASTTAPTAAPAMGAPAGSRGVRRERMTKIRQRIAERLVEAKHTTAMLTTFNECDMTEVMRLRATHKEAFEKAHGVGLGFMGFFVAACVSALRRYPRANAYFLEADPESGDRSAAIEYHDYCDVAVAVGTERGLVVPVIRNAESLSLAGIELAIRELATKARENRLTVEEMTGGTFTVSNGGVYGSLNSTPILNPPQSAILGMHAIKKRPVEDPDQPGQIALRPMMFLALSYDHRIIDGAEAVGFLVQVKTCIEQPERVMLGL